LGNRSIMPAFYPNARLQRLYYFSPSIHEQPPFTIRHQILVSSVASAVADEVEPENAVPYLAVAALAHPSELTSSSISSCQRLIAAQYRAT
jgi:hypothetical protein